MSIIPIALKRCPLIPSRYRRAKCWKRCKWYDPSLKGRCTLEVVKVACEN